MKKAILLGASGLVGTYLLHALLDDPDYESVTVVVRKMLAVKHPKLTTLIGDYHSLPTLKEKLIADELFITIGTTKTKTPDQNEYYQIDHDYPVLISKIAKENGATSVLIVTAVGADAGSGLAYTKTKGETERDIVLLDFKHTHIFRPSMIMGERQESRPLERIFMKIWPFVDTLLFGETLSKYKGMEGKKIAKAMVQSAKKQTEQVKVYHWPEMNRLA